jgi:hypothetical protein
MGERLMYLAELVIEFRRSMIRSAALSPLRILDLRSGAWVARTFAGLTVAMAIFAAISARGETIAIGNLQQNYDAQTFLNNQTTATGSHPVPDFKGGSWNLYDSASKTFSGSPPSDLTLLLYSTTTRGSIPLQANSFGDGGQTYALPAVSTNALFSSQPAPAADELAVHPGGSGRPYLWIKWTAGTSGTVDINGWIHNISADNGSVSTYDGVILSVLSNSGTSLGSYTAPSWHSGNGDKILINLANISVTTNENLYFVIDPKSSIQGDNNGLSLDITMESAPEPGTVVLLGIGMAGLGLAGWRRRKDL